MCLYSALRQGFCYVAGDILAAQVQQRSFGYRCEDECDQGPRVTFGRPDNESSPLGGHGCARADTKGQLRQRAVLGQAAARLGPGFRSQDHRAKREVGKIGMQVFGLHQR